MTKTGAQTLIDTLIDKGVEYVFGIPGGAVLPLFDTIYNSPLKFILTRHEQAAGHAADGFARATGKVGVCLVTSGPGATNLTTAIATAFMDSVPIIAITGQVKTNLIGNDAFQEADVMGITRSITKHSYLVEDLDDLPRIINEAFYIASTGRCGPVVIDLPVDITMKCTNEPPPEKVDLPGYKPKYHGNPRQIKIAAEAINNSQRPVLYTGGGIILSGCSQELLKLAEKANMPVTTTLMGLGGFPETNALSLGMLGMHGTGYANHAVQESDLLIAIGSRFDDRVTGKIDEFAPKANVIHVDI
ncbi:MAG: thiamine pyrophosphate-binding protein, partial [Candidatus Brocadiales bacterium]